MSSRKGIDLFHCSGDGKDRRHVGEFCDLTAAKKRSRIDYRGGIIGGHYVAIDRSRGRTAEEWKVVGNPDLTNHTDCVRLWPEDRDELATAEHLPAPENRIAWALKRIGRRREA